MDRIIVVSAKIQCSATTAFELFTTNTGLESWLTVKADVTPEVGGKYELFWNPDDPDNNSTKGCKILAIDKPNYINFEWSGPQQYKHFMNSVQPFTNVTVLFTAGDSQATVTLIHTGWRDTEDWEEARQYFINAWTGAFNKLEQLVNQKQ